MLQPGPRAVARMQERQPGADRQPVVAHRGKNENLVERQRFGEQAIEPDIGEQSAGQRELARAGAPEPPAHRLQGEVLGHLLDRGRDRFAVMALADRHELFAHRRPVAEIRSRSARRRR